VRRALSIDLTNDAISGYIKICRTSTNLMTKVTIRHWGINWGN